MSQTPDVPDLLTALQRSFDAARAERKTNDDAARVEADLNERRTNTRDRLARLDHAGDGPFHRDAAINWLAWEMPDVLNEALDNTGAPE